MKRNNIFMWAYISFIILSALLRIFVRFSLWSPIVLAITVSSVFFALEDLFASLYHSTKDYLEIVDSFISEMREKNDREMKVLAKFDEVITLYEDSIQGIVDKDLCESLRRGHLATDDNICSIEKDNEEKRNELKTYKRVANVGAYVGFLCLFCTLILATSFSTPEIVQEIFTVVPFALILITRQLNGILSEQNGEILNECKSVLESQARKNETLLKLEEKFDDYVSRIADGKQKEATHAD